MAPSTTDVLVAAYKDVDTATRDFATLMHRIRAKLAQTVASHVANGGSITSAGPPPCLEPRPSSQDH